MLVVHTFILFEPLLQIVNSNSRLKRSYSTSRKHSFFTDIKRYIVYIVTKRIKRNFLFEVLEMIAVKHEPPISKSRIQLTIGIQN